MITMVILYFVMIPVSVLGYAALYVWTDVYINPGIIPLFAIFWPIGYLWILLLLLFGAATNLGYAIKR